MATKKQSTSKLVYFLFSAEEVGELAATLGLKILNVWYASYSYQNRCH